MNMRIIRNDGDVQKFNYEVMKPVFDFEPLKLTDIRIKEIRIEER